MKTIILLIISFLFFNFYALKSEYTQKKSAYIYLASGYMNDTVSLFINTVQIFKNEIVNSKKDHNDLTNVYIKITDDSIFYYKDNSTISTKSIKWLNKSVKIILTINNRPYNYTLHLKQGRYLFISKHSYYHNVYFNQFKKPVTLY